MRKELSKRLVVDACVAFSAGEGYQTSETSAQCRRLLEGIRHICHGVVMTPELSQEWRRRATRFSSRWLTQMQGQRKWHYVPLGPDEHLREDISAAASTDRQRTIMLEDAHLVEAARATDGIIISSERSSRQLLNAAAANVPPLQEVAWVNPLDYTVDEMSDWLEAGAMADPEMRLGAPND